MPNIKDLRATYGASAAFVSRREELPFLLNQRKLVGCGVEVGVQRGHFSEHLLRHWHGMHLISVDPWATDEADNYVDIANVSQPEHDACYQETVERLAQFGPRSSIWWATSVEAAKLIPDYSMDFVYIDARHDFASVMEDLEAWHRKVRPGGIFAGHDYVDGEGQAGIFGVKSAVDTFFGDLGLPVHVTLHETDWPSWIVAIPQPEATPGALPVWGEDQPAIPGVDTEPASRVATGSSRDVTLNLALQDGDRQFKLRLDGSLMSQKIMLDHFDSKQLYEAETSRLLATILRPGDTFLDVGSHVGYFSMLAASIVGEQGTVVAFEPDSRNFRQLETHIEINGFQNVAPINAAVGETTGQVEFHFNSDNDGGHALWDVGEHPFNEQSRTRPTKRTIDMVSLDAILSGIDIPAPRAIKIDTEGAEHSVLKGALQTLTNTPVDYVVAEINRFGLERMGTTEAALRGMMTELGYETLAFNPDGLGMVAIGPDDRVESDYVFNLVFRHQKAAA